jgi:hypothetical protein
MQMFGLNTYTYISFFFSPNIIVDESHTTKFNEYQDMCDG